MRDGTVVTGTDSASAMVKAPQWITAEGMAKEVGIDPKQFRAALRKDGDIQWHGRYARWTVQRRSPHHDDMVRVLSTLKER
jgi:hypothetical protein